MHSEVPMPYNFYLHLLLNFLESHRKCELDVLKVGYVQSFRVYVSRDTQFTVKSFCVHVFHWWVGVC